MKKSEEFYNYLKRVPVPKFKNDSLKQHLKNELYNIIDQTDSAKQEKIPILWKPKTFLILATSVLACALILLFIFPQLLFIPDSLSPSFIIGSLGGDVDATYNGDPVILNVGQTLRHGTSLTVAKEASCDIHINKKSLFRIYENSKLSLDAKENIITVQLSQGTLVGHVNKYEEPFTLQIITESCIIGIKSTTFMVMVEELGVSRIALLEGTLSIKINSNIADKEYSLQSDQ